jgi:hypothetical protein
MINTQPIFSAQAIYHLLLGSTGFCLPLRRLPISKALVSEISHVIYSRGTAILILIEYNIFVSRLFWQNKLDMFNSSNPVVGIINSELYLRILLSCIFLGVAASLKRLFLAIYLGRRAVTHFGPELETLMAKMIIIGEVANLSRDIESKQALFVDQSSQMYDPVGESERLVRFQDLMIDENSSIETNPSPSISQRKMAEVSCNVTSTPPRPEPGQSPPRPPAPNSPSSNSASKGGRPELESSSSANLKLSKCIFICTACSTRFSRLLVRRFDKSCNAT